MTRTAGRSKFDEGWRTRRVGRARSKGRDDGGSRRGEVVEDGTSKGRGEVDGGLCVAARLRWRGRLGGGESSRGDAVAATEERGRKKDDGHETAMNDVEMAAG